LRRVAAACVLSAVSGCTPVPSLYDSFEGGTLDMGKWTTSQVVPKEQVSFRRPGRCGEAAITVTTRDRDGGLDCDPGEICQRAELRTHRAAWPAYDGREVWYAFSFRIDGEVPANGSARTVIGQWKAPGDDSPFLAQRFDNGVFHITVEDKGVRRVIAQAEGDPDRTLLAQQALSRVSEADLASLGLLGPHRTSPPPRRNRPESRGFLEAIRPLAFVAEPQRFIGPAEITVIPEGKRLLPDPRKGWVDMVYRIKGGRTDNQVGPRSEGEVDVWANGEKIVSVRGNLGNRLRAGNAEDLKGPYFKFGLYRKKIPGTVAFAFDEFSQAGRREDLAPLCGAKPSEEPSAR
jgi:hypothetical protein